MQVPCRVRPTSEWSVEVSGGLERVLSVALTVAAVAVALLCALPSNADAQARLLGVVLDSAGRTPLASVRVSVDAADSARVTDATGRFMVPLAAGTHTLRLRRIGYAPAQRSIVVRAGDTLVVEILMTAQAQVLEPTVTEAPRNPVWPPGLADRRREGFGTFITDSVLRRFDHTTVQQVLRSQTTWVQVIQSGGRDIATSRRGGQSPISGIRCPLTVWLDGIRLWEPQPRFPDPPPDLGQFSVAGLEAVELYTASEIPPRFRGGSAACGVLLLWSRQHLSAPPGPS
jgi:Carboxypeptidase regulatory-like domain